MASAPVKRIDADAHVHECPETWDYLEESERRYRPRLLRDALDDGGERLWLIDDRVFPALAYAKLPKDVSLESATLSDPAARLAHMDALDVDVQVLFPTVFLHRLSDRVEVEIALTRAYNRWLAERCADSGGRLQWVMELPWGSVSDALDELEACRRLGACGVHGRGVEAGRVISDPYFFPVFAAAESAGLPICIHAGSGDWRFLRRSVATPEATFIYSKLPGVTAFHVLAVTDVYDRFPALRFGFVELSASWVSYLSHDIRPRLDRKRPEPAPERLFEDRNLFVAFENDDDLDDVLRYLGAAHLILGSDYGHNDTSAQLEALDVFSKSHEEGFVRTVLEDNPGRLYRLSGGGARVSKR